MDMITPEEAAAWLAEVTGETMTEPPAVEEVSVEDAIAALGEEE